MGNHQRRALGARDDVGDCIGLATTRHAEQRLLSLTVLQATKKLLNRLGLVTGGAKVRDELKVGHELPAGTCGTPSAPRIVPEQTSDSPRACVGLTTARLAGPPRSAGRFADRRCRERGAAARRSPLTSHI